MIKKDSTSRPHFPVRRDVYAHLLQSYYTTYHTVRVVFPTCMILQILALICSLYFARFEASKGSKVPVMHRLLTRRGFFQCCLYSWRHFVYKFWLQWYRPGPQRTTVGVYHRLCRLFLAVHSWWSQGRGRFGNDQAVLRATQRCLHPILSCQALRSLW